MNRSAEQQQTNPLREGLSTRAVPQPCSIVIFGATGDLTHRKLIPALYNLADDGELPPAAVIIGFARRPKSDDDFRKEMEEAVRKFSRQAVRDEIWKTFSQSLFYHQSEFGDEAGYKRLSERLSEIDKNHGTRGNRLFYLAAGPDQFEPILKHLKAAGLNQTCKGSWARIIIEKPFGTDLASARELNRIVRNSFSEEQTYRIDHFLGKETAQNILVLRFANAIFAPLWNTHYIDHLQITAAETLGVEARAGYYETAGALRDMVQNHLLQLLCLVAMEPPTDLSADSIRDEKVKVVRSLRRWSPEDIVANVVRGQYTKGAIHGDPVADYRQEQNVNPDSQTETFVALRLFIDDWRWADVPVYMRVGKRLPKSATEISIHFKKAPPVLFNKDLHDLNVLVIRIQPDEGISLRIHAKVPGTSFRIEPVKMDFHYGTSFGKASPEAYERLLLDAMSGDATLFARRDEVEEAWAYIDPIEEAWHAKKNAPGFARILKAVDPRKIKDRQALAALPVTRKSDLAALQKAEPPLGGLNATPAEKMAKLFMSPGPLYEPEGRSANWWRTARGLCAAGFRAGDRVLNTFAYHFTPAGSMLESGALALGCTVVPGGVGQTEMQVAAIAHLKLTGYIGTPSFLKLIVEKAGELQADISTLRRASVGAEYLPPALRAAMGERGIQVTQTYGTADLGLIARPGRKADRGHDPRRGPAAGDRAARYRCSGAGG